MKNRRPEAHDFPDTRQELSVSCRTAMEDLSMRTIKNNGQVSIAQSISPLWSFLYNSTLMAACAALGPLKAPPNLSKEHSLLQQPYEHASFCSNNGPCACISVRVQSRRSSKQLPQGSGSHARVEEFFVVVLSAGSKVGSGRGLLIRKVPACSHERSRRLGISRYERHTLPANFCRRRPPQQRLRPCRVIHTRSMMKLHAEIPNRHQADCPLPFHKDDSEEEEKRSDRERHPLKRLLSLFRLLG